ncbi:MAG: tetratricopeptide repeat protein [Ignavibacteria bacterium]|nr:tetratricopeptide repeat protein [Ignavibacteria bacterium]
MKKLTILFFLLSFGSILAQKAEEFYKRGNVKADSGDVKAAIAHYNYAIEIDPKFSNAYMGLGLIKYLIRITQRHSTTSEILKPFSSITKAQWMIIHAQ